MKRHLKLMLPVFAGVCLLLPVQSAAQQKTEKGVREITVLADDAASKYTSRVFDLKHIAPTDIVPFVNAAVKRYSVRSSVQRVTSTDPKAKGAILVSTNPNCMPFVEDLIKKIDKPGRTDANGSLIEGTGITRIAYSPKYRAAEEMVMLINDVFGSPEGKAYLDKGSNTIYWKDQDASARATLAWVEYIDRPLPQAEIRLNYYEVRESDMRDIGLDYLAWKNGPGTNLLNLGYNAGKLALDEAFTSMFTATELASKFSSSWGYGGFFTAPAFDMSFVRILQQSGSANLAGHMALMVTGTPVSDLQGMMAGKYTYKTKVTPEYINIAKTNEGRTYISYTYADSKNYANHEINENNPAKLGLTVFNPVVCFAGGTGASLTADKKNINQFAGNDGGVIFSYTAEFGSVVERGGTGLELGHSTSVEGSATLAFNKEKILTVFERESDVEQFIGLPFFHRIPILKYLFGTTTTVKERTYIVVTAEATLIHPEKADAKRDSHTLKTTEDDKFQFFKSKKQEKK